MNKVSKQLHQFGLDIGTTDLYLALLAGDCFTASQIARKVNRPKSSVFDDLQKLVKMGFVIKSKKKNAYIFRADPSDFKEVFARRRREAERLEERAVNVSAELAGLYSPGESKPKIEYYEGHEGVRAAFEDTLRNPNKEIIGYGTVEPQMMSVSNYFPEYYQQRAKKRIHFRGILPSTPETLKECIDSDQHHLRTSYLTHIETFSPIEVNVYDNTVSVMSLSELFAVLIRSRQVAGCFRQIFELAIQGAELQDVNIREKVKKEGLDVVMIESQEKFSKMFPLHAYMQDKGGGG